MSFIEILEIEYFNPRALQLLLTINSWAEIFCFRNLSLRLNKSQQTSLRNK